MPGVWSNAKTLQFLKFYAAERLLWDPSDKSHKLKHKVHDAWKRLSENMNNISIEELKTKKKNLMTTYRNLLKKKKASMNSGAGADDVSQPIWFAYDLMESFLGTIYDVVDTINTESETQYTESMPPPSPSSIQKEYTTQDTDFLKTTKTSASKKRPKNNNKFLDESQNKLNESFDTLSQVLKEKTEEDECDVYAKLLAKKLRKYPERMRDKIMYKIDGLLLDNPYPYQRSSSECSSYSQEYYPYDPNSTPSPVYVIPHSPIPEGNETAKPNPFAKFYT